MAFLHCVPSDLFRFASLACWYGFAEKTILQTVLQSSDRDHKKYGSSDVPCREPAARSGLLIQALASETSSIAETTICVGQSSRESRCAEGSGSAGWVLRHTSERNFRAW